MNASEQNRAPSGKGVAIIVPVYNAARFLAPCLDSIIKQSYPNLSIFLVDDQSTDRSGALCDDYARRDPRVRVIHQPRAGPGSARNAALARIDTQEYVMFVDADDYLAPNAVERCVDAITKRQTDMVICNFANVEDLTGAAVENAMEVSGLLNGRDLRAFINGSNDLQKSALVGPAWRRLLKCRIVRDHGLRFPDGEYLAEDIVFMARYFRKCQSFYALDEVLYFKRQHAHNLSRGFNGHDIRPMMLGHEAYKILLSDGSAEENLKLDRQFRDEMIGALVRSYHPRLALSESEKRSRIRLILNALAARRVITGYPVGKGHSRVLAWSIRTRCIPLIQLAARRRARRRYGNESPTVLVENGVERT